MSFHFYHLIHKMFPWLESLETIILWLAFCLSVVHVVIVILDNNVDRFGSFYASAMFQSTDKQKVPLQFYIKFAIERETHKRTVFKEKYKRQAQDRIIKYLFDYATKHNTYLESDLHNTKIRNAIRSDIINWFDVKGLELINVLDAENH